MFSEKEPLLTKQIESINRNYTNNDPNDDSKEEEEEFEQIDGGYGWIVCLATFWCFGIIIGMDYNYSLIYNKLVIVYNTTENHVVYAGKQV
jgi:hypothetical protein